MRRLINQCCTCRKGLEKVKALGGETSLNCNINGQKFNIYSIDGAAKSAFAPLRKKKPKNGSADAEANKSVLYLQKRLGKVKALGGETSLNCNINEQKF